MREYGVCLTREERERFVALLVKMVKLQRLMRAANYEQQELIFARASSVVGELVEKFGGDELWCNCILTFGGQYFGQDTQIFVGDNMDDEQLALTLGLEVDRQESRR